MDNGYSYNGDLKIHTRFYYYFRLTTFSLLESNFGKNPRVLQKSLKLNKKSGYTGKSLSEPLISASTNPQYDNRITISIHENSKLKPRENMLCTEIVSDIQNDFCTQHVLPM